MEITQNNFASEKDKILQQIEACDFVAIDFEFSGLARDGTDILPYDEPAKLYSLSCQNVSEYLVLQMGLSTFKYDSQIDGYAYEAYTIFVFPRCPLPFQSRVAEQKQGLSFLCQASSLDFLSSHGFDFNKWIKEGVSYMHLKELEDLRANLCRKSELKMKNFLSKKRGAPNVPDDLKPALNSIIKKIAAFVEDETQSSLVIESPSRGLRRHLFDAIQYSFGTKVFGELRRTTSGYAAGDLCVERCASDDEFKEKFKRILNRELELLDGASGIASIFSAIAKSKLVVGHNMFLDLLHAVKAFCCPLPPTYSEFKEVVQKFIPRILDTKFLASQSPLKELINDSNSLNEVAQRIAKSPFKRDQVVPSDERFSFKSERQHEAGYDAFLTGSIFVGLANYLGEYKEPGTSADCRIPFDLLKSSINKIHCPRVVDLPYLNLGGVELTPERQHIFHLQLQTDTWTTNDCVNLFSPFGSVKIRWINDKSAFIELLKPEKSPSVLNQIKKNSGVYSVSPASEFLKQRCLQKNGSLNCGCQKHQSVSSNDFDGASVMKKLRVHGVCYNGSLVLNSLLSKRGLLSVFRSPVFPDHSEPPAGVEMALVDDKAKKNQRKLMFEEPAW